MNLNIGCIETRKDRGKLQLHKWMNLNIGCIETAIANISMN